MSVRMALGALIIEERLGTSDRETVQQITENPYLQYFIGLPGFQEEPPFHHALMTHFRKRLNQKAINQINEWIVMEEIKKQDQNDDHDDDEPPQEDQAGEADEESNQQTSSLPSANRGKLLLDVPCALADIAYPTDLSLLNEAREKLEGIIDTLHAPFRGQKQKPPTYRQKARRDYLKVAKQKRPGTRNVRKAIGQQLRYIERNLKHIAKLAEQSIGSMAGL